MMTLILNEDQTMLQEAAASFIADSAPVSALRQMRDSNDETGFSRELWSEMAQMGWAGILVPEEHGGAGFGMIGAGVIAEEMGRHLTASPFLSTAIMAATAIAKLGSAEQAEHHLPKVADGSSLYAVAIDEGAKHRPSQIAMKAERDGNGFRLTGGKTFIADGHVADHMIVAARTSGEVGDEHGITLFLVDATSEGLDRKRTPTVDSRGYAAADFDNVRVDADAVLGEVDGGREALNTILDAGRAGLAAELTGSAAQAFDMSMGYIRERKQFGVPVGSFQALQHRAAHLYCEIEIARAITLRALQACDADSDDRAMQVALAKAKTTQVALLAAQEGVQMHGGMGMTDEFDIGLYLKRVKVAGELLGDASFHGDQIAQILGY